MILPLSSAPRSLDAPPVVAALCFRSQPAAAGDAARRAAAPGRFGLRGFQGITRKMFQETMVFDGQTIWFLRKPWFLLETMVFTG